MEENKKRKALWPILLFGTIGLGLLYLLFVRSKDDGKITTMKTTQHVVEASAGKSVNTDVLAYIQLIDESHTGNMSLSHEFTNRALMSLIKATESKAEEINFDIKADMDKARSHAHDITIDPYLTTHADSIRVVATTLAGTFERMQQAKFPGLNAEAQAVKAAAQKIDPKVLTLDQKGAVYGFLDRCADFFRKMNE